MRDRPGRWWRIALRLLLGAIAALVVVAAVGGFWLRAQVRGSLPVVDGEVVIRGLSAPVLIERDSLGVVTIRGATRLDVARATGFVHAQERFFQMDLSRRRAAGELAELFGPAALPADRALRIHQFRARARRIVAAASAADRALMEAYAAGVNAGLASLKNAPFEYLVLRSDPAPWRPEDAILVVFAMYVQLQDENGSRESVYGVMHDLLPEPLYEFLAPRGTEWDAPVVGEPFRTPAIPGPEVWDLRAQPTTTVELQAPQMRWSEGVADEVAGSNNWAVAGSHTTDGRAILANDMHLAIRVPNTWYRASLVYRDDRGRERRITGVTLPGAPVVVVGSNGAVAWGFTNSYGDWSDLVVLEPAPGDSDAYLTPEGPRRFEHHREVVHVKGREDEVLDVVTTLWGPVVDRDHRGRRRALRWVAHDPEAVNLGLLRLEKASSVEQALELANRTGVPAQNFVVADSAGHIGWTILGPIPRRFGFDGRLPTSWADGSHGWAGYLSPAEYPRIVDPPGGRIWTANARVVSGPMLAKLGDGGYALGARARQIRDDLFAVDKAREGDMLRIQLDDRARFLQRWHDLLLQILTPEAVAADPRRAEFRRLVEEWGGRAAVGSAGYRMVRAFRIFLSREVFGVLTAACRAADSRFSYGWVPQREGPLWRLVSEQPAHLLDPRFRSWQELFLAVVDSTIDRFVRDGSSLAAHTWGERNTTEIRHPLSRFIPGVSRWLDMPRLQLPGDSNMPRVQGPASGASERLVVSPGHEEDGLFHMPCGQSGHPLSPYYRKGHLAWAYGEPRPFLPGPAEHVVRLVPGEGE